MAASGRIPVEGWQPALDANGVPISGARLMFYEVGSTTPASVFSDPDLLVPLPNPVIADAAGQFPSIFASATAAYNVRVMDAVGAQLALLEAVVPIAPGEGVAIAAEALEVANEALDTVDAAVTGKMDVTGSNAGAVVGLDFNAPFNLRVLGPDDAAPPDGVYVGSGGNNLSFQTLVSYPMDGADSDNQRGSLLLVAETSDDGNSEEQTLCVLTTIRTGYSKPWTTNTAYDLGDNITFPSPRNTVYRCIQGGVSASSGEGPTGKGQSIEDGTCIWRWINDAAINAKVGIYNEVVGDPGGGSSWAQANNFDMKAGFIAPFAVNTELDLTNNTGVDSDFSGQTNKYNLYVATQGANTSTASVLVASANTDKEAAFWGLQFVGPKLASRTIISFDASAPVGIGFGPSAGGVVTPEFSQAAYKDASVAPSAIILEGMNSSAALTITADTPSAIAVSGEKSLASFNDFSTSPVGFRAAGTYSGAAFSTGATTPVAFRAGGANSSSAFASTGTTPAALAISGEKSLGSIVDAATTPISLRADGDYSIAGVQVGGNAPASFTSTGPKSLAGFYDASVTPIGFQAGGTYSTAAFASNLFSVGPGGEITGASLRLLNSATPSGGSSTGAKGQIIYDDDYLYVCTDTNTWKRVALTTF